MNMRVTLLGVGEAFDTVEPCASALVEADGFRLMIDCGHSIVSVLWRTCPAPDAIDAVYLTHHHADHVLGLLPVLDRWAFEGRGKPLSIWTTEPGIEQLQGLLTLCGVPFAGDSPYPIQFLVAAADRPIGPFAVRLAPTRHSIPNQAIRLQHGGRALAYSGDGRPTAESLALYADADLLLHECFMPAAAPDVPFHCDLPTIRAIDGPARIGLYHVKEGRRPALQAAIAGDPRLFMPQAGAVLSV